MQWEIHASEFKHAIVPSSCNCLDPCQFNPDTVDAISYSCLVSKFRWSTAVPNHRSSARISSSKKSQRLAANISCNVLHVRTNIYSVWLSGVLVQNSVCCNSMVCSYRVLYVCTTLQVDMSVSVLVDIQNTLINALFMRLGTDEQKRKYLPQLATNMVHKVG